MFFSKEGAICSARNSVALDVALDLAERIDRKPHSDDEADQAESEIDAHEQPPTVLKTTRATPA